MVFINTGLGTQSWTPQNASQWHIDYLELKLLKKDPLQERHTDPPFLSPWRQEIRRTTDRDSGVETSRNKPSYFFNLLPKPKLCLFSSLIKHLNPKFCVFFIFVFFFLKISSQMYCIFVKKYKSCLFWSLFRSYFSETSVIMN